MHTGLSGTGTATATLRSSKARLIMICACEHVECCTAFFPLWPPSIMFVVPKTGTEDSRQ